MFNIKIMVKIVRNYINLIILILFFLWQKQTIPDK